MMSSNLYVLCAVDTCIDDTSAKHARETTRHAFASLTALSNSSPSFFFTITPRLNICDGERRQRGHGRSTPQVRMRPSRK